MIPPTVNPLILVFCQLIATDDELPSSSDVAPLGALLKISCLGSLVLPPQSFQTIARIVMTNVVEHLPCISEAILPQSLEPDLYWTISRQPHTRRQIQESALTTSCWGSIQIDEGRIHRDHQYL